MSNHDYTISEKTESGEYKRVGCGWINKTAKGDDYIKITIGNRENSKSYTLFRNKFKGVPYEPSPSASKPVPAAVRPVAAPMLDDEIPF